MTGRCAGIKMRRCDRCNDKYIITPITETFHALGKCKKYLQKGKN